ncbi:unnamed protein product, partial [Ectocarpus sp. 12 AP-2014]
SPSRRLYSGRFITPFHYPAALPCIKCTIVTTTSRYHLPLYCTAVRLVSLDPSAESSYLAHIKQPRKAAASRAAFLREPSRQTQRLVCDPPSHLPSPIFCRPFPRRLHRRKKTARSLTDALDLRLHSLEARTQLSL